MLIRACITVTFCILIFVHFGDLISINNYGLYVKSEKDTFDKLPSTANLNDYLRALQRIIDFCTAYNSEIDINFDFGLFLAYVNLKHAYKEKYDVLPDKLRYNLKELLEKTERLLDYFSYMVRQDHHPRNLNYKAIYGLFTNASTWIKHLPKFNSYAVNEPDMMEGYHMNWYLYTQVVNDIEEWVPAPDQSDLCLQSLVSSDIDKLNNSFKRCKILKSCYRMLKNGTDFGYALTHRLLFLLQARLGRGCVIFSEEEDKQLTQKFCSLAHREARYIAFHKFVLLDLLLEQMCLCSLDGHVEFLQRSWLADIVRFQTEHGCFSESNGKRPRSVVFNKTNIWKLAKSRDHSMMGGQCNGHTTALAAATYAMAIRFILETYYYPVV